MIGGKYSVGGCSVIGTIGSVFQTTWFITGQAFCIQGLLMLSLTFGMTDVLYS